MSQVWRLVCVVQNRWLIERLICEAWEAPDSRKGEISEDTLSLVAIRLMN